MTGGGCIRAGVAAERRPRRRHRVFGVALALLLLACFGAGCAGIGEPGVPPEQRAAYDAAVGRLPADPDGASRALEDFVAAYPRSLLADDAVEQLGRIALADGRQEEGMSWLGRVLSQYPDGDRAAAARLRLAQIEFGRDKRSAARRLLAPLVLDRLSLSEQRAALRLRVALSQTPVERLEQLSALRGVLQEEARRRAERGGARDRLDARLQQVDRELSELIARAASAELEAMMRSLRGRPPAASIALELSRRALESGQLELAEERLRRTERLVRTPADRATLEDLQQRLVRLAEVAAAEADLPPLRDLVGRVRPNTDDARGTIGVVLPLSGDFEDYGRASLRGILLATDVFASSDEATTTADPPDASGPAGLAPAPPRRAEMRVVVRDSGGDAARAAAQVRDLAQDPSIVAIIGPIFSSESLAAAEAAESMGVPLVALSAREEVPEGRANAFRTRTTPADEVGVLVGHAFEALGAQRFAVLYPRTRFGRGMRKLYWDAIVERGGKMVAAASYEPDTVDFSSAIRDIIGYRFLTDAERKALAERDELLRSARRLDPEEAALLREEAYGVLGPEGDPLPPIVDFDVLFIPDVADTIALIAPSLAFHEVRGVQLLGTSDWLDPELLRVARQHVSGAVISSPFHPSSDLPFVVEFVEGYRDVFGMEPDVYAAEAYDATNLVLVQLSSGRRDRAGVRAGLLDTRAFPGATGAITMHPNGNARRRPFLLRVSGRRFRPMD